MFVHRLTNEDQAIYNNAVTKMEQLYEYAEEVNSNCLARIADDLYIEVSHVDDYTAGDEPWYPSAELSQLKKVDEIYQNALEQHYWPLREQLDDEAEARRQRNTPFWVNFTTEA